MEVTRNERHRKSDELERHQREEAENTKKAKLETTSADNAIAQGNEDNCSGYGNAAGSSDDISNNGTRAVQDGTKRLAEAERKGV